MQLVPNKERFHTPHMV